MTKRFALTTENGKLTCPELAGYRLPSCSRCQEYDVVSEAWASTPNRTGAAPLMYKVGYTEARQKFEFSRQDLIDLVESLKDYTAESNNILGHDEREASEFVDIFLNGRTPRTPIAIEVEMAKPSESFGAFVGNVIGEFVPVLNPDGTVKGRWVYE